MIRLRRNHLGLLIAGGMLASWPSLAAEPDSTASAEGARTMVTISAGSKPQFTIGLPAGWKAADQMMGAGDPNSPFALVIFSSADLSSLEGEEQIAAIGKIDVGELPSFFLQRGKAPKGATCASFPEKAQKSVVHMIEGSSIGDGVKKVTPFEGVPTTVGGCSGVRVKGRYLTPEQQEWTVDAFVVSDGATQYIFSLRNQSPNYARNLAAFESTMATVKLAAAP